MDLYSSSEITVHQLNELKQDDKKIQIIDVREDTERDHAHIKGTIHMKLSEIAKRYTELDKKKNIFVSVIPVQEAKLYVNGLKHKVIIIV